MGSSMFLRQAKRLVIFVIGSTVALLGLIMLFTPGQGILTILAGLAILATEFVWARVLLKRMRAKADGVVRQIRGMPQEQESKRDDETPEESSEPPKP